MKLCTYVNEDFESCSNPREGNTMCCASHNRVIRKQLTDSRKQADKRKMLLSKPKKVYKAPNKISDKRKVINEEYAILREQFLRDHPTCELKLQPCTQTSTQVHHTASGWNKSTNLNNVSTWKASCDHCNQFLHDKISAKEARELGLKI
jgi:hypothetical protein